MMQKHMIKGTEFCIGSRYSPKKYLGAGSFGCVI